MSKPAWDLQSPRSMAAAAEWLRERADANLVLIVRGVRVGANGSELEPDVSFAVHAGIAPLDAVAMVEVTLPEMLHNLMLDRKLARELAADKVRKQKDKEMMARLKVK
jgi:hypothetical protein